MGPNAPRVCRAIGSGMTIPQFSTRGHADTHTWRITAPRFERDGPDLKCRIRAATRWEGRIVKEAYDTITFWGAVDPARRNPDMVVESPVVSDDTLTVGQGLIQENEKAHAALDTKIDTVAQTLGAIAKDVSFLAGRQAERDRTTGR